MEELARSIGKSSSSFFPKFKPVTTLSSLQFHKALRLYEARRLMLASGYHVASATYAVGYESQRSLSANTNGCLGIPRTGRPAGNRLHSDDGPSLTRFMKLLDRTFSKLLHLEEKFTGRTNAGNGVRRALTGTGQETKKALMEKTP